MCNLILLFILELELHSQLPSDTSWNITSLKLWKGIYLDGKYVISSPLRWDREAWHKCILIIGHTGGIMTQDEKIRSFVQERRTSIGNTISSKVIGPFGAEYAIIGLSGLYLTGYLTHNTKLKRIALIGAKSASINGVVVGALKILIGRSRPDAKKGDCTYYPFNIHPSNHSFPSGHTSTAFAIASCLADECKNSWVTVIGYTTAILVGVSRIYDDKHWASDVSLGGIIGISIGKTVAKLNKKSEKWEKFY